MGSQPAAERGRGPPPPPPPPPRRSPAAAAAAAAAGRRPAARASLLAPLLLLALLACAAPGEGAYPSPNEWDMRGANDPDIYWNDQFGSYTWVWRLDVGGMTYYNATEPDWTESPLWVQPGVDEQLQWWRSRARESWSAFWWTLDAHSSRCKTHWCTDRTLSHTQPCLPVGNLQQTSPARPQARSAPLKRLAPSRSSK
jgi:hypothetical protein